MRQENKSSFFGRLAGILAPSDVRLVQLAYIIAKSVHRGQVRQELDESGEPKRYFEHLRRAALVAIVELGIRDVATICALLLHDAVEDRDMDPNFIEQFFGRDVAMSVLCVTKIEGESAARTAERVFGSNDVRVMTAKLCDRVDNIRSLVACAREKRLRKIEETRMHYLPGFRRLCEIVPPHQRQAYINVVDGLEHEMRNLEIADQTGVIHTLPE